MDEETVAQVLEEQRIEDDDYITKIQFEPSLQECQDFLVSQLIAMVDTTNKFYQLEYDLMQNLPRTTPQKNPNFSMTEDFPWIIEAKAKISAMC